MKRHPCLKFGAFITIRTLWCFLDLSTSTIKHVWHKAKYTLLNISEWAYHHCHSTLKAVNLLWPVDHDHVLIMTYYKWYSEVELEFTVYPSITRGWSIYCWASVADGGPTVNRSTPTLLQCWDTVYEDRPALQKRGSTSRLLMRAVGFRSKEIKQLLQIFYGRLCDCVWSPATALSALLWYIVLFAGKHRATLVNAGPIFIRSHRQWGNYPENKRHSYIVDWMLGQRRRRWPSIHPIMCQRLLVFSGNPLRSDHSYVTLMASVWWCRRCL